MIKLRVLINPISFIKLLVYNIAFAVIILLTLLLLASNLYSIKSQLSLRYLIPTIEFLELYQKIIPALQFVGIGYFGITTMISASTAWINYKKQSEYNMELKYSSYFVLIMTQAFMIVNFSQLPSISWAMILIFLLNAGLFFWSNKLDGRTKILDNNSSLTHTPI